MNKYYALIKYKGSFNFIISQNLFNYIDIFFDYAMFAGIIIFLAKGSALDAAFLAVSYNAPKIIFSTYIGRLADILDYNKLFKFGNLIILVSAISMFFTYDSNLIFLAIFIKSFGRAITGLAMPKLITSSIEKNDYQVVNSLVNVISNMGKVIGPIAAGLILNFYSIHFIFSMSVVIAVLLNISILSLRDNNLLPSDKATSDADTLLKLNFNNVLKLIHKDNILKAGLISYSLAMVSIFMSDDLLTILFREIGGDIGQIGLLISIVGIGGIFGSQLLLLIKDNSSVLFLKLSLLFDAICFLLFGFLNVVPTWLPGYINLLILVGIMGIGTAFGDVGFKTMLYQRASKQYIGLISGVVQAFSSTASLLCPLIGAFIASKSDIFMPFRITGALMAILFVYASYLLSKNSKLCNERNEIEFK